MNFLPLFLILGPVHASNGLNRIVNCQPEQIHLALGNRNDEFVVTWVTHEETEESIVEYGIGEMTMEAIGYSTVFVNDGWEERKEYIHRAVLKDLKFNTTYVYHCGSSSCGWSHQFWFKTLPEGEDWSPSLAIYGDLGNENAMSLTRLQNETQRKMYDVILHVGDFAYDMNDEDGWVGSAFLRQIETVAAYVPYMVCPGNHEGASNFSNYKYRFSMPGGAEGIWYSFDVGPVHFISISTEIYYFTEYGMKQVVKQYYWLLEELVRANLLHNREKHPWIVIYGHRPMYCSNDNDDDCTNYDTVTRVGLPFHHLFGLEKLIYEFGVDLVIWAHEHDYERLWPIYDYQVYNGSYEEPYTNPTAPVHIVTGSAGCKEGRDPFIDHPAEWSAFHSEDYGYTRMKVHNASHMYLEQVSVEKNGEVVDSIWIIKDKHGKYPPREHKGSRPFKPKLL